MEEQKPAEAFASMQKNDDSQENHTYEDLAHGLFGLDSLILT